MSSRATVDNSKSHYVVAADIGGTQMRAALVNREGRILERASCPTEPERGIEDAASRVTALMRDVSSTRVREELAGVGISSAGPINPDSGIYDYPPNLPGWHGSTMKPTIMRAMSLPVTIGHDARVAAIAETLFGAAKGKQHVVYVTVSTGIGGGIISGGQPVIGTHGLAGEVGHLLIDPTGPPCNAGCMGCLEVLASGGGAAREARRRIEAGEQSAVLELAGGDPDAITGRHVYEAADGDDLVAGEIVEVALNALSIGLSNLLAIFDPELLIVGGSVVEGLMPHWDDLLARVQKRGLLRYRDSVPITMSPLGDDVSILGAAAVAFDSATG